MEGNEKFEQLHHIITMPKSPKVEWKHQVNCQQPIRRRKTLYNSFYFYLLYLKEGRVIS